MKTYNQPSKKSEPVQSKAVKQAPVDAILNDYKSNVQLKAAEEDELLQGKFDSLQLQGKEEDELLQGKFETTQLKSAEEDELLQGKFSTAQLQAEEEEPLQKKENNTGLPDNLKSGVENLSGYSMDDVKVHYNSAQPAELQAHAYAQGTDIHVAPGQEKHLPHEAWHVAQQKQGRVKPTMQMKGKVNVNDDAGLETEADVMGAKALQMHAKTSGSSVIQSKGMHNIIQAKFKPGDFPRPNFHKNVYKYAVMSFNVFSEEKIDENDPRLGELNGAVPHRMPWADVRDNTIRYLNGEDTQIDFLRWTDRFISAANEDMSIFEDKGDENCDEIVKYIKDSIVIFEWYRQELIDVVEAKKIAKIGGKAKLFLNNLNSFYPNVPDIGPHRGTNIQVSNRAHMNIMDDGSASPMTMELGNMTPDRFSKGVATKDDDMVVTTSGNIMDVSDVEDDHLRNFINQYGSNTNARHQGDFDGGTGWF